MLSNKSFKIFLFSTFIVAEVIILTYLMIIVGFFSVSYDKSNCYNLPNIVGIGSGVGDVDTIGCIGYIHVNQWADCGDKESSSCGKVYLYDSLHNLSFVHNIESYKIINKDLYLIGDLDYEFYEKPEKLGKIFVRIPIGGEFEFVEFNNPEDVPRNMKIDGETGNIFLYENFNKMDEGDEYIFKELEANKVDYVDEYRKEQRKLNFAIFGGIIVFLILILSIVYLIRTIFSFKN